MRVGMPRQIVRALKEGAHAQMMVMMLIIFAPI